MKEFKVKCPCCNENIIIQISDIGDLIDVFFYMENEKDIIKKLNDLGYEFGVKGGELDG